ncbi:MAG: serine/threonine-protein kinase [Bryobacteraceae bacterium]|nr:serine/threonine-protein kinase [Bryobacteraceae bacterium]
MNALPQPALAPGARIGPYEILSRIGVGGMGEVYRARDSKLAREVAIKVLPQALATDTDYLARFQREAHVLAQLNHPNIAIVHGLEDNAIVMELVRGPTLAERLEHGPIPLEEALGIARQVAEALEAAHEKGIIHRDLKAANIKFTHDGVVKVLDIGLAKPADGSAQESGSADSPTLTVRATQAGIILGTAAYMSPEQAAGKPLDRRSDIWSYGVVLWEMLTGHRLFQGETFSHTLADVLRAPIDFTKLPPGTPPALHTLLRRCLDRDVKTRLRDIGEARIAIASATNEPQPAPEKPHPSRTRSLGHRRAPRAHHDHPCLEAVRHCRGAACAHCPVHGAGSSELLLHAGRQSCRFARRTLPRLQRHAGCEPPPLAAPVEC